MTTLDDIKVTFFEECSELLEAMEAGLIEMSEGAQDEETVNAVFRAAHSIKGGAGAFAFEDLVSFAHTFETTLDEVRSGRLTPGPELLTVFLRSADVLSDLVAAARDNTEVPTADVETLVGQLKAFVGGSEEAPEDAPDFEPMALDVGELDTSEPINADAEIVTAQAWRISFKAYHGLYARGSDPAILLRALTDFGPCDVSIDPETIPLLDCFDETLEATRWNVTIHSEATQREIAETFEFVEEDCEVEYTRIDVKTDSSLDVEATSDANSEIASTVPSASDPSTSQTDAIEPAEAASASTEPPAPLPAPVAPQPTPPIGKDKDQTTATQARPKGSIRVELDRVDRLINLVGELVVNQAMLAQSFVDAGLTTSASVATGLDEFKNLTRDVQDSVMAIRAQPVRSLFQRMSRIVREAATATGKTVKLHSEGETTEIDKTVIDLLSDPLTHMIRNAIDHGLEQPSDRIAAGKPAEGVVTLTAAHKSGRVVIEIADDGAGINRERVLEIAIGKGLIPSDNTLTGPEIDNLLFLPGFSTAQEVSNLSGRGVGMDVVKQAIQKLGGRITITTEPGAGSTFTISLPLTLAVLDGMVVQVDGETLVVPLTSIVETLRPEADIVEQLGVGNHVVYVRDEYVPILDVGKELGFAETSEHTRDVLLLIDSEQSGRWALGLDAIVDQRQVVIKSLEDNYGQVDGVAAATILGNGRIALILDPDALVPNSPPQQ